MRLSNKVLLTLGVVWAGFLGLAYVGAHNYLINSFLNLENEQINKNVIRVHQAIDQVSYALGTFTTDWAHWNEAYDYAEGHNPQFVSNNFAIAGFINSNINLIMYFDRQGKILVGMAADLENKKNVAYQKGLEKYIYSTSQLVHRTDLDHDIRGLIALPSGWMLVAASGLSYGDKSKPINGSLVAGRNFSNDLLKKISNATELDLVMYTADTLQQDNLLKLRYQSMIDRNQDQSIELVNHNWAYAYTMMRDINNDPIGMIRVIVPRLIFQAGSRAIDYYLTAFLLSGVILAALIGYLLRVLVLKRLEMLNRQIKLVSDKSDYSQRIQATENDELSSVTNQFNEMMATIQSSHAQLESQVQVLQQSERTLEITNIRLTNEINERKHAEANALALHNKLILSARRAGMADIVSGILHNIGNILNSVVTSVDLAKEKMKGVDATKLVKLVELLKVHQKDLANFIINDPQGKQVIEYLALLAKNWDEKDQFVLKEIMNLDKNIAHIKNVISMQQSLSSAAGMTEEINVAELIEDAIILSKEGCERAGIKIIYEDLFKDKITVDRVKLLHMVINLIKNSVDSLLENNVKQKKITIRAEAKGKTELMIQVRDNGVGIAPDKIKKIFSYGYTTKKTGHGFGLHTSAISAQEMGGTISAESKGEGLGATFTVVLPIYPIKKAQATLEPSGAIE